MEELHMHTCKGEAVSCIASLINGEKMEVGGGGGVGIGGVERVEVSEEVTEVGLSKRRPCRTQ